jgi:hypothetical protein
MEGVFKIARSVSTEPEVNSEITNITRKQAILQRRSNLDSVDQKVTKEATLQIVKEEEEFKDGDDYEIPQLKSSVS